MSITPSGPKGPIPKHAVSSALDRRARQAEQEAQQKIEQANERVTQAQREYDLRLDSMKDEYIRRSESEADRQANAIESQRNKGYEAILNLRRQQEAEIRRIKREGEREAEALKRYYQSEVQRTEIEGEQKLDQLRTTAAKQADYEQGSTKFMLDAKRDEGRQLAQQAQERHQSEIAKLEQSFQERYAQNRENYQQADQQSELRFKGNYETHSKERDKMLSRLDSIAAQKIREKQLDYGQKLSAYDERNEDPFYRMVALSAELEDQGESFVLTARIPEHERERVSVAIRGNEIVVSGQRRNEEKVEIEPGRFRQTSSYQSYSESFPLNWPIEARAMRKEFEGEYLVVTLPKKTSVPDYQPYRRPPEKVRAERPEFPGNLPKPPKTDKGSGTIS